MLVGVSFLSLAVFLLPTNPILFVGLLLIIPVLPMAAALPFVIGSASLTVPAFVGANRVGWSIIARWVSFTCSNSIVPDMYDDTAAELRKCICFRI